MTKLNCCVTSCVSNCDGCCTREGIQVVGEKATQKQETMCASYHEKNPCVCNSKCECPNVTLDVDCSACECMYNINCKCNAPCVDIRESSNHSECDTFRKI